MFTNGAEVLFARSDRSDVDAWDLGDLADDATTDPCCLTVARFALVARLLEAARLQLATLQILVGALSQAERSLAASSLPGRARAARAREARRRRSAARRAHDRTLLRTGTGRSARARPVGTGPRATRASSTRQWPACVARLAADPFDPKRRVCSPRWREYMISHRSNDATRRTQNLRGFAALAASLLAASLLATSCGVQDHPARGQAAQLDHIMRLRSKRRRRAAARTGACRARRGPGRLEQRSGGHGRHAEHHAADGRTGGSRPDQMPAAPAVRADQPAHGEAVARHAGGAGGSTAPSGITIDLGGTMVAKEDAIAFIHLGHSNMAGRATGPASDQDVLSRPPIRTRGCTTSASRPSSALEPYTAGDD